MADIFIAIDNGFTLTRFQRNRGDLIHEFTCLLRRLSLVLARSRKFVLSLAADLPLIGDILGGLAHVIAIKRVPQTITNHCVDIGQITHFLALTQAGCMGAHRHIFLTTSGNDCGVTQHDVLCPNCD